MKSHPLWLTYAKSGNVPFSVSDLAGNAFWQTIWCCCRSAHVALDAVFLFTLTGMNKELWRSISAPGAMVLFAIAAANMIGDYGWQWCLEFAAICFIWIEAWLEFRDLSLAPARWYTSTKGRA